MNKTVIIDCDEQGNYSVGEEAHEPQAEAQSETEGGQGDQGEGVQMQPAKSLDEALQMARQIFEQGAGDNGEADAAMQQGYQNVAGSGGSGMGVMA